MTSLSPDAMQLLVSYLDSRTILRLYFVGCIRLQILLKENVHNMEFVSSFAPPGILPLIGQFRRLKSLEIISYRVIRDFDSWHVSDSFFIDLPPDLQKLVLPWDKMTVKHLSALPKSLTSLSLSGVVFFPLESVKCLPSMLLELNLTKASIGPAMIKELPRTLTILRLQGDRQLSDPAVSDLPASLTTLMLPENVALTNDAIKLLPSGLVTLNLRANARLTDECVPALPRLLSTLVLMNARLTRKSLSHLPPLLTHVTLPQPLLDSVTDEDVMLLPRGIHALSFIYNEHLTANCISFMPTRILSNRHDLPPPINQGLALRFISDLPRDSTQLQLPTWVFNRLTDEFVEHLPRGITEIDWPMVQLSDASVKAFPPSLLILRLRSTSTFTDAALKHLPSSLTVLSLPKCTLIGDIGLQYLPRGLLLLDLSMNRLITDAGLPALPMGLQDLLLHTNANITDAGIPALPKTLTRLDLSWNPNLTDAAIPSLPPNLVELKLDHCKKLTDACLPYFPKTLTRLTLTEAAKLTKNGSQQIKHIKYLSLPSALLWS